MIVHKGMPMLRRVAWRWTGCDHQGERVGGVVWAQTEMIARARVRRQGIRVLHVRRHLSLRREHVSARDIALFVRQLATLTRASIPLLQAFDIVTHTMVRPVMVRILLDIRIDIASGLSLAEAFHRRSCYFDLLFCRVVAAGEVAGALDVSLERLATSLEKRIMVQNKIRAALIYPAIVALSGIGVAMIIVTLIIPQFRDLFAALGAELPMPTQCVLWLTEWIVAWYPIVLSIIIFLVLAFIFLFLYVNKVRLGCERFVLGLPIIGALIQKANVARWTRTLSMLLAAGVPLIEALEPVGYASSRMFAEKTAGMVGDLSSGLAFSLVLQRSKLFPTMVVQMTAVGEESGLLEEIFNKIADYYDIEFDNSINILTNLIEPVIMIILGLLIGVLVLALYLPIFRIGHAI